MDLDTAFTAGMVGICSVVMAAMTGWALAVRLAAPARRARRFAGRWLVRGARWAGRRWDALWLCPACRCDRRGPLTHPTAPRTYGDITR